MNGEPIPWLNLTVNPYPEEKALAESLKATEAFLRLLSKEQRAQFIGKLASGETLRESGAGKLLP